MESLVFFSGMICGFEHDVLSVRDQTPFKRMPEAPPPEIKMDEKKVDAASTPSTWQKVTAPVTYFFPGKKTETKVEEMKDENKKELGKS